MSVLDEFLNHPIEVDYLELLVIDLPQKMTFKSGIGLRRSRKAMILKWVGRNGVVGYGECSARPDPFYSAEFLEGAALLVRHFIAPHLGHCRNYGEVLQLLNQVRGWPFTKSAVEFALHDWLWRSTGDCLFNHFPHPRIGRIPVGISIGILPDLTTTEQQIKTARAEGYHRLKFKVRPDFDLNTFLKAEDLLVDEYVSFDANGTLGLAEEPLVRALHRFGNAIEQPFLPYDLAIQEAMKKRIPGLKVCLDESVKSLGQLMQAHRLGLIDELNLKVGRVGGLYAGLQMLEYCFREGLPVWIGGMFETGIGRSLNLQVASFLPDAVAHDLSPSSRYFAEDVLKYPVEMSADGYIQLDKLDRQVDDAVLEKYTIKKTLLPIHP